MCSGVPVAHGKTAAVHSKWMEVDLNYKLANLVNETYTFGMSRKLSREMSFPSVWMAFNEKVLRSHHLIQNGSQVGQRTKG